METYNNLKYSENFTVCHGLSDEVWDIENVVLHPNTRVIKQKAFCGTSVKSIEFNKNLELIEDQAFRATKLENLTINSNVRIFDSPFEYNENLKQVTINAIEIPSYCFNNCNIENLVINSKRIGKNAFFNCNISNISFLGATEIIEKFAFQYTDFGTDKINLPNTLKLLGFMAFANTNLSCIKIPDGIKDIGERIVNTTDKTKILVSKEVYNEFKESLDTINVEICSIEYLLENGKSFKEINNFCKEFETEI